MRIAVCVDPNLLKEANKAAAESGCSLNTIIEDALRDYLSRRRSGGRPIRLITDGEGGTLRGIDLNRMAALLDVLDSFAPHR